MTRLATTAAILGMIASGLVLGLAGCSSDHSGLGLPNLDAQAPRRDAAAGSDGAGGAGRDAPIAGSGGSGGVVESGGVTVMGGSSQAEAGAGGSTPSGGAIGGFAQGGTGGSTPKGGTTTGGATQAGGSAQQGGTTAAGGVGGTAGVMVSGGTRSGGTTAASGGTPAGGTTAASGGTRTGGTAGSGGSTPAGGGASGGMLTGGTTGTGGTSGRICGAGLKSCLANEFCEMPTGLCNSSSATGTCVATPGACGDVYQPVCGCDGTTYTNDCERQVAHVSRKSYGACAAPDGGAGGSTGTGGNGGSTAIGGKTATGGMSTGGGGAGGVGGSSGGHPECVTASDCQLFSDCCNCVPIPVGTSMVSCMIACIQSSCAQRGLAASDVACIAGRCTFGRACKPAAGVCPVETPVPQCPAGQAPLFVGSCPSGGCAKVEDCAEVSSCDACTGTAAAPTGLLCATFQTLPPSYHCVSTPPACGTSPTCACMGICSGGLSCITQNSLTCQCPEC